MPLVPARAACDKDDELMRSIAACHVAELSQSASLQVGAEQPSSIRPSQATEGQGNFKRPFRPQPALAHGRDMDEDPRQRADKACIQSLLMGRTDSPPEHDASWPARDPAQETRHRPNRWRSALSQVALALAGAAGSALLALLLLR